MIISRNFKTKLFNELGIVTDIEKTYGCQLFELANKVDESYTVIDFYFPSINNLFLDIKLKPQTTKDNFAFNSRRLILADLHAYDLYDDATIDKYAEYEFRKPVVGDMFISTVSGEEIEYQKEVSLYGIKRLCKPILPEIVGNKGYTLSVFTVYDKEKVEIPKGHMFIGFRPPKRNDLYLSACDLKILRCDNTGMITPRIIVKERGNR